MFSRLTTSLCLLLLVSLTNPIAALAVANEIPGWDLKGDAPSNYSVGVDASEKHDGANVAFIKFEKHVQKPAGDADGFGTLMQMFKASHYVGKRVRFSGFVKTKDVQVHSGLWMRIDGINGRSLGFDNMSKRSITGTNDWKKYDVVLDVPPGSDEIALGVILSGEGQVWVSGYKFEEVDRSVPVTAEFSPPGVDGPVNLGFGSK